MRHLLRHNVENWLTTTYYILSLTFQNWFFKPRMFKKVLNFFAIAALNLKSIFSLAYLSLSCCSRYFIWSTMRIMDASCIPIMHKRENVINKIGLWHQMMMIGSIILAIPHRARQQFFVGAARICCMSFMTLNCQLIVKCKRSSCAFCH